MYNTQRVFSIKNKQKETHTESDGLLEKAKRKKRKKERKKEKDVVDTIVDIEIVIFYAGVRKVLPFAFAYDFQRMT